MTPTIVEVAKKAKVSKSAVSDILNRSNQHKYTARTVHQVVSAAAELGYKKNYLAQSLKTGTTNIIGIKASIGTFFGTTQPYLAGVYQGIGSFFLQYNYKFLFHNFNELENQARSREFFQTKLMDGLIIVLFSFQFEDFKNNHLEELKRSRIPFVVVHSTGEDLGCANVGVDCAHGGYRATQHLIGHGYETIGTVVAQDKRNLHVQELFNGYAKAMAEHGRTVEPRFTFEAESFMVPGGYKLAEQLIGSHARLPRALFVTDDGVAYGMLKKFNEAGIRVPQDLALVGFGDEMDHLFFTTPLTSIKQPAMEKGQKASEFLLAQLQKSRQPGAHQFHVFKPELTVNRSCGCGAG